MNDTRTEDGRLPLARRCGWALLLVVVIAVAAMVFWGYSQPEFLLEAVNLRYCG